VASHTLTQPPSGASSREVKNSGLLRWLFGRRAETETPERFTELLDEHLNIQSRHLMSAVRAELLAVVKALSEQQRAAASPIDLDGSLPAYQLRHIAMLSLDGELRPEMTWRGAVELLQDAWDQLNARADEQDAFERHTPVNKAEAEADGALLFASGRRGKPIGPGSERGQVAVAEIVDRAKAATTPTALQAALTPDVLERLDAGEPFEDVAPTQVMPVFETVPASAAPSPVHIPGEDLRPPVPDSEEDADPGDRSLTGRAPLPKRHKIVSFPADMSAVPGVPAHGSEYAATELLVLHGAWMLTRGVWSLVESVSLDAKDRVIAHPAVGETVALAPGEPVWLLAPGEAAGLVGASRAQLNEAEASR